MICLSVVGASLFLCSYISSLRFSRGLLSGLPKSTGPGTSWALCGFAFLVIVLFGISNGALGDHV